MTKVEITNCDLVKFAKKAYELSVPQGLGFLHARNGDLSEEDAKSLIRTEGRDALNMDYIHGRACKMHVSRDKEGKLFITVPWYDHTHSQLKILLNAFGLSLPYQGQGDHGPCCNCAECKFAKDNRN
jgi:hypothetical protein